MSIKILQVIPSLAKGGAERLVIDLSLSLNNIKDIELIILVFNKKNEFEFLTKSLNIKYVQTKFIPSILKKNQVDVVELQNFVDEFKPDVIHLHLYQSVINFTQIQYNDAKYFIHFHDNMIQFQKIKWNELISKQKITNWFERQIVFQAFKNKKVCCIGISNNTFSYIKSNTFEKWSKVLLLNGINTSRFESSTNIIANQIITIGSLVENKNHELAIEIINNMRNKGIDVNLIVLGEGVLRKKLEAKIKLLKLDQFISLKGNVDLPEIYLSESKIYLHTAKSEAFGLVLLEAMSSGLPIVCTDAGGNRDIIEHGKNGYIFQERNTEVLANQIIELLENEPKRQEIGQYAQKYARKFDIKHFIDRLIEIYNN